ncbi:hypothetical protein ACFWAP_00290 [Streptomyces goshikiensis]|uniref:hypothetical protein n=1 Tax=Streptomyces goshikiensis TaxID=1942 RepID=UPI00366134CA
MTANALEVAAATLSGIARNAPKGSQSAVGQAADVLASKLAGLVGKNITTSAGTFRISLGRVIAGAKCISFAQIATSTGREQPNTQPGNDCVPPPNNPNWQPPDKCFLGRRPNQPNHEKDQQEQNQPNHEENQQEQNQPNHEENQQEQNQPNHEENQQEQNQQPESDHSSTTSTE